MTAHTPESSPLPDSASALPSRPWRGPARREDGADPAAPLAAAVTARGPEASRRGLLAAGSASVVALALAACGDRGATNTAQASVMGSSGTATDTFPVTVEHVYGSTEISAEPTRVATVGRANQDVVIALGVVPVGVPVVDWGGDDNGSSPWTTTALEDLGAGWGTDAAPAQYSESGGLNAQEVAALEPDLIVGVLSGMTQEDYDALSAIAPTIAFPEGVPAWGATWQDCTTLIGQALGRSEAASELIETTTADVKAAAAEYPALEGATFVTASLDVGTSSISLFTEGDNRTRFLEMLGMTMAPVAAKAGADTTETFFVPCSAQEADRLEADLFWGWVNDEAAAEAVRKDPLLSSVPAVADGTAVLASDQVASMSMSAASPLSLPWACESMLPGIAAAVEARTSGTAGATSSAQPTQATSSPAPQGSASPSSGSATGSPTGASAGSAAPVRPVRAPGKSS